MARRQWSSPRTSRPEWPLPRFAERKQATAMSYFMSKVDSPVIDDPRAKALFE